MTFLTHWPSCKVPRLRLQISGGTLPGLIYCEALAGGCGRWTQLAAPSVKRAIADTRVSKDGDNAVLPPIEF